VERHAHVADVTRSSIIKKGEAASRLVARRK